MRLFKFGVSLFFVLSAVLFLQAYLTKNAAAASAAALKHKAKHLNGSGNPSNPTTYPTVSKLLYGSYKDSIYDIKSYPSFLVKNRYYVLGFAAILSGSLLLDRGTRAYTLNHQSDTAKNIEGIVEPFGSLYYMMPAVSLLSIYGYYSKNTKLTNASITSMESLIFSGIITEGLKISVGRQRPDSTDNPFNFKPFNMSNTYKSFPSGDATVAWSMITPYAVYYKEPTLYLIPVAVDLERIYRNKHWLSDTLMGSAIGFSIGYFFSKNNMKIGKNVSIGTDGQTINLNYKF